MKPDDIYIVMPAYNEAKSIGQVIKAVNKITPNVIVVDDGSTDPTSRLSAAQKCHVLRHPVNLGKGAALKTGCEYAFNYLNAQAVILMDADGQHHPQELTKFIQGLRVGHSLIFGVRQFDLHMPLLRRLANRFASGIINWFYHQYIPDIPCGFKAMTLPVYHHLFWESSDYGVEMEIAVKTAKYHLPFWLITIDTIYQGDGHGMTSWEAFQTITAIISWKLKP